MKTEFTDNYFSRRNLAIDMLRAITMLVMIFVNDLWSISDVPHWLEHAEFGEDFAGLSDFVFPCFLFVMGMSIPYAIENRYAKGLSAESTLGHILVRSFTLLIMGVFTVNSGNFADSVPYNSYVYYVLIFIAFLLIWNRYPSTPSHRALWATLRIIGCAILIYLMITCKHGDGSPFRASWWGILGIIGWAYLFCASTYLLLRRRPIVIAGIFAFLIVLCISTTPLRDSFGASTILGLPEGHFISSLLSSLHIGNGCMASLTMGGVMLSLTSARLTTLSPNRRLLYSLAAAAIMLCIAIGLHQFFIVSKLGETPTWVFYTYAIAITLYFTLNRLVELGHTRWFVIIKPAGTATLTAYLMPYIAYGVAGLTGWHVPESVTHSAYGIIVCISFSFIMIWLAGLLGKLHIRLKI